MVVEYDNVERPSGTCCLFKEEKKQAEVKQSHAWNCCKHHWQLHSLGGTWIHNSDCVWTVLVKEQNVTAQDPWLECRKLNWASKIRNTWKNNVNLLAISLLLRLKTLPSLFTRKRMTIIVSGRYACNHPAPLNSLLDAWQDNSCACCYVHRIFCIMHCSSCVITAMSFNCGTQECGEQSNIAIYPCEAALVIYIDSHHARLEGSRTIIKILYYWLDGSKFTSRHCTLSV